MTLQVAAFALSCISVGIGLTTLSLVIRNELRARRMNEPILWDFHRYASRTRTDTGEVLEVAELVQFGRQPTRVSHYHPVGFKVRVEEGYRLRSHVKAEDTVPLLLEDVDVDNAWMLISHFPRDDRRWLIFEWVPLEPTSEIFRAADEVQAEKRAEERRGIVPQLSRAWALITPRRSVVRPVGPTGYPWARIRADRGAEDGLLEAIVSITSLADAGNPSGSFKAV